MLAQAHRPTPDAAEIRTNATFAALMWALSRPGTVQSLPAPGMAGIAEALVDRECRVHADTPALRGFVTATGAHLAEPADADHVFMALNDATGLAALAQVPVGSALYPDAGATVIAAAQFGAGQTLHLTGPGIQTMTEIKLNGLDPGLWALRAARCIYPTGFDLFLIDGAHVMGLPRSTLIGVL